MTVDAILRVIDPGVATNVDLRDIKVITKLGWALELILRAFYQWCGIVYRGTVEDTELVDGLVLDLKASHVAGGVTRVEKAKIGLIQFCISPPKTDVNAQQIVSYYCQYIVRWRIKWLYQIILKWIGYYVRKDSIFLTYVRR